MQWSTRFKQVQYPVLLSAFAVLAIGFFWVQHQISAKHALLLLVGAVLGMALFQGSVGFTAAWRRLVSNQERQGVVAQLWMLGVGSLLFIPVVNYGYLWQEPVVGAFAPVGVSLILGAALFGAGMQLANGCGSGVLFSLGGGSFRMWVALLFFVVGSVVGSMHLPWWLSFFSLGVFSLPEHFGVLGALLLQWAMLLGIGFCIYWFTRSKAVEKAVEVVEKTSNAPNTPNTLKSSIAQRMVFGPWPLAWSIFLLIVFNFVTLGLAGHPWGITAGFSLWGAKILQATGLDMQQFAFWTWPQNKLALQQSVLVDVTSLMNFGLLFGAMLASSLAGQFKPQTRLLRRPLQAAILGGLLMGYGARLAFGCNIGAMFGGIISGSLHGWLWMVSAFLGSLVGLRLRPYFYGKS